jgi:geranylgeranyl diphosphate synthase type II
MSQSVGRRETSFTAYVRECRAEVESAFARYLPGTDACPPVVADAMRYSLKAGGKRLRPVLTLAAAEAVAGPMPADTARARQLALPAACAIELVHTYSLIHDDLPAMDDDTMRRGRPTLHVVFGEGLAILAGDGMLAEAFALLAREPASDGSPLLGERKLRVIQRLGEAAGAAGMVGGQAIDLECAGTSMIPGRERPSVDAALLKEMHARKTGALIRAAAVSGAIMAGGSSEQIAALDRFAADLGLAFQIVDDILDVEGASDELGKTAGKDAAADKPTYPALFGLERSRALADEGIGRARQTLLGAGLADGWLSDIADWVVGRTT